MSKIEWTQKTWNPTTGCTKISSGCKNCYAEVMAKRLQAMGVEGYENSFEFRTAPQRLAIPLNRKKPTIYFVNSMSDLFHEKMPLGYLNWIFTIIKHTPQHTYQILTKRAKRMSEYFEKREILPNVWLGVTVEDKKALYRIEYLRKLKAKVRFISFEPLLEDVGNVDLTGINWVIVGGESGKNARPMHENWLRNIKQLCEKYDVSFFFKQWRAWKNGKKRNKKANGCSLDGKVYHEMPKNYLLK